MYALSSTFRLWRQGFRGDVSAVIDSVGHAVGFFGSSRGQCIVPMAAIRRVRIGVQPAMSGRIYTCHLWHAGSRSPIVVRGVGDAPHYAAFVRHLLKELAQLDASPDIRLGSNWLDAAGAMFVPYGIFITLSLLLALGEFQYDQYSIFGIGRWGAVPFLAATVIIGAFAWRHHRHWHRQRSCSPDELERFLP